jgi:anaerobic ribonucleoside-triphosphate reductase activating protein
MLIRIAGITEDSIVDGPGLRLTVFVQGCPHNCPGCHNPETHRFDGGQIMDTAEIITKMDANPLLDGLTLSGGEPFCQWDACIELADAAHQRGLNVWCYTGYTYRQLTQDGAHSLLDHIDVLVDGPYIESLRTLELPWRGSRNQRLIDVQESLRQGKAVEYGGAE